MVIALRSVGTRGTTSIGVPSGTTTYDVVVIAVNCNLTSAGTFPTCTGFTLAGIGSSSGTTGRSIAFLTKRASGSESGTYTIGLPTGGSVASAEAYSFTGVAYTGSYYTTPNVVGAATSATTTPAVNITDTAGDYRMLAFATNGTSVTITTNISGWTEISPTASSIQHAIGQTSAGGASGALSLTMSASSNPRVAGVISLIADTTGGPPTPPADQNLGFFAIL